MTTSRPIRKMIPIAPPRSLNMPYRLLRAVLAGSEKANTGGAKGFLPQASTLG
jgi:hypothetical protein